MGFYIGNNNLQSITVLNRIGKVHRLVVYQNSKGLSGGSSRWLEAYSQQGITDGSGCPEGLHVPYISAVLNNGSSAGRMSIYLQRNSGGRNLMLLSLVVDNQRCIQLGHVQHIAQLWLLGFNVFNIILFVYLCGEGGRIIIQQNCRGHSELGLLAVKGVFYLTAHRWHIQGIQHLT